MDVDETDEKEMDETPSDKESRGKKKKKNPLEECRDRFRDDMNEITNDIFG